ncbi:MAG TPA: DUF3570 domain-containing protein [Kofleriaceae bacterium]|nr:DUF3570 domain-containing protein [Kofleriaceae bacterium]
MSARAIGLAIAIAIAIVLCGGGRGAADPAPDPIDPIDADYNARSTGVAPPGETPPTHDKDAEADADADPPSTGAVQGGVYADSDRTTVWRTLGQLASSWGNWALNGRVGIDVVSSASIDVRTSPQLGAVDVVTSASGRSMSSGGQMTDTRYEVTGGGTWNDSHGHTAAITASAAHERDYDSVSGGWNGSIDVLDRTATILAGLTLTDNRVSSVLDDAYHGKMFAAGWSGGVARVLTRDDALRLRYDGRGAWGDQASPYRYVRFGDWNATTKSTGQIVFSNTIGSASGLPEKLPQERIAHAVVLEWVHALGDHVGLHPSVRLGHDSWGVDSVTGALDLRVVTSTARLELGYRYYRQGGASFFADKYTMDPSAYTSWTSDKELGPQEGHLGELGLGVVLHEPEGPGEARLLLELHGDVFRYAYPGFALLPSRLSAFVSAGLTWEL